MALPPVPPPLPPPHRGAPPAPEVGLAAPAPAPSGTPAGRTRFWQAFGRRAAGTALVALACAVGLGWASSQVGWFQQLLVHLPAPAQVTAWLRQPDLATLPGLPAHWNPWAPLTLQQPDGPFTRRKLAQLEASPAACLQWLADAPGLASTPLPDRAAGTAGSAGQCGWQAASRISGMGDVRFSPSFVLACGAAVALARWEHQVLQPAARARLGAPVVRIEHLGSYACRRIAGSDGPGRLSEHARANALDVAAFTLQDGRRISVLGDWQPQEQKEKQKEEKVQATTPGGAPTTPAPGTPAYPKAAFLRQVRDGACQGFSAVLGPAYNAAHRDHFHLDRGRYRACR